MRRGRNLRMRDRRRGGRGRNELQRIDEGRRFSHRHQDVIDHPAVRSVAACFRSRLQRTERNRGQAGETLVETLIAKIEERAPESVLLPVKLVVRGSS